MAFAETRTVATEVVESTPSTLIYKQRQEYTPRLLHWTKPVNSLVTLTLDPDPDSRTDEELEKERTPDGKGVKKAWMECVKYHKEMW